MELKEISDQELFELIRQIFPNVSFRRVEDNRNILIHLLGRIQKIIGGVRWKN